MAPHQALELVVRLDEDDPRATEYPQLPCVTYLYGPRVVLSECWNECWRAASGDIYGLCGDDLVFATKDWVSIVTAAFPSDGIAYVHGDDLGGKGDWLGTHGFVSRQWTEAIGTFVPPYFSSDYNDLWLNEIANALGRRIYVPVVTEHMHPAFGKAQWDLTHMERVRRHWEDDVDGTWRTTEPERLEWVEKLRAVMQ